MQDTTFPFFLSLAQSEAAPVPGKPLRTNFVLIDFENVQPEAIDILNADHFRIIVFVGASQGKIPFEVVRALQPFGSRADYVKISGNGSNALDFHIAFYIGQLAAEDPRACFHIISRDAGFDPLIQHLKAKKIVAARWVDIRGIPLEPGLPAPSLPVTKPLGPRPPEPKLDMVIACLKQPNFPRPRTTKTLSNSLVSMLRNQSTKEERAALIKTLEAKGLIKIAGGKITYFLPGTA